MRREISAWQLHRNQRVAPINWRFATEDARIKLIHPYPKLKILQDSIRSLVECLPSENLHDIKYQSNIQKV
jgi:hypothetical protein